MLALRKLNPLRTHGIDVWERLRPESRTLQHGRSLVSYKAPSSLLVTLCVYFLDPGFQVAGQSGQSGACAMKRASSTAAATARCTARTPPSVLETALSTRIACTMKFLVCILSSRRTGWFRRAVCAQAVKLGWDFLYYKLGLDASGKTRK